MDIHNYPPIDYTPLFEKGKNFAVHCETEEEAEHFIARMICDHSERSSSWTLGETRYERYRENTCYNPRLNTSSNGMSYCSLRYYKENGFTIIPFRDLLISYVDIIESDQSIELLIR